MNASPPSTTRPSFILASRSPRRRKLLDEAGALFEPLAPAFDDAALSPGRVSPEAWVGALAYLKAWSIRRAHAHAHTRVVLGADTIVDKDGAVIGQPQNAAEARRIIRALRNGSHSVVTGVAIIAPPSAERRIFADRAEVTLGDIDDAQIESYLASGAWRGKAGAYNLEERLAEGWPIEYEGDATTIMGLPMNILTPMLRDLGAIKEAAS